MTVLGVDIGTTGFKMGVYRIDGGTLDLVRQFGCEYEINTYNDGLFSDIEPEKWRDAFVTGCRDMAHLMPEVDVIALSGTTPGMTAMDGDGNAVYPAILMLDQRSREEAQFIIDTIGFDRLLAVTGNMPVAGGCSLASMLWIRNNYPDIFGKARVFGHSNTYMAKFLTGRFAIDPSSASLTALYNTAENNLTWNNDILAAFGLSINNLPELMHSHDSPGRIRRTLASELGLRKEPPVVIGGNDAVLAAYSVGIGKPGDIINVNGTCEITLVCLPRCISSPKYNIRAHVIPDRWLTLYVMNACGKAYEWFRTLFCADLEHDAFYSEFMPHAIETWLNRESTVRYVPFLMGSRYSQEPLKAEFHGLTHGTTREELLAALVRGLCEYQREHLDLIERDIPLTDTICVTGGAVNPAILDAKRKWMRDCDYAYEEQSSMKGAAMIGKMFLESGGRS